MISQNQTHYEIRYIYVVETCKSIEYFRYYSIILATCDLLFFSLRIPPVIDFRYKPRDIFGLNLQNFRKS